MKIVLDCDILNMLMDRKKEDNPKGIFVRLMHALDFEPCIVEYVADNELMFNEYVQELIREGEITVLHYDEYLNDWEKEQFEKNVWVFAEEMAEDDFSKPDISIFAPSFRYATHNIGEIITELFAAKLHIPYFASNDWGAKNLAKRHFNSVEYQLVVNNLAEMIAQLEPEVSGFAWKEIKYILKDERWSRERDKLRSKWCK